MDFINSSIQSSFSMSLSLSFEFEFKNRADYILTRY